MLRIRWRRAFQLNCKQPRPPPKCSSSSISNHQSHPLSNNLKRLSWLRRLPIRIPATISPASTCPASTTASIGRRCTAWICTYKSNTSAIHDESLCFHFSANKFFFESFGDAGKAFFSIAKEIKKTLLACFYFISYSFVGLLIFSDCLNVILQKKKKNLTWLLLVEMIKMKSDTLCNCNTFYLSLFFRFT